MLRQLNNSVLLPALVTLIACSSGKSSIGDIGGAGTEANGQAGGSAVADDDSVAGGNSGASGNSGADDDSGVGGNSVADDDADDDAVTPDPPVVSAPPKKVDLLVVVDNSQGSGNKQEILALSLPRLVSNLLNPPCVDESGVVVDQPGHPSDDCGEGTRRAPPIQDLHVGVITTSLGGSGGPFCEEGGSDDWSPEQTDMAHLMGTVRSGLSSYKDLGFLAWDSRPDGVRDADATNDIPTFTANFEAMVLAAGERGCGFEAPLEAWYRFLIDPEPYVSIDVAPYSSVGVKVGIDDELLAQRAAFLRDDSAVAILMLSDENDCSIQPEGLGNLTTTFVRDNAQFLMRRGTAACADDPNDPCCVSCATSWSSWPSECPSKEDACADSSGNVIEELTPLEDASNLRCFDQKRRFGLDFLHPTSRYSVALTSPTICPDSTFHDGDCECRRANQLGVACDPGTPVTNPLFATPGGRSPSAVTLHGILGVPWQDIVSPESLEDPGKLALLGPAGLRGTVPGQEYTYWDMIAGSPKDYEHPRDPYMVESIAARQGSNPMTGESIAPANSSSPTASSINGHERNTDGRDLQFACTFSLPEPVDCTTVPEGHSCECWPSVRSSATSLLEDVEATMSPLCQDSEGQYATIQFGGKAYPTLRQLEVLRELGDTAMVSSICPKTLDSNSEIYAYDPGLGALSSTLSAIMSD